MGIIIPVSVYLHHIFIPVIPVQTTVGTDPDIILLEQELHDHCFGLKLQHLRNRFGFEVIVL